jgi:type II secretory pathway pseudopilin PulG
MKNMKLKRGRWAKGSAAAFTLIEAVVSMTLGAMLFTTLYGGFAWGFANVQAARESLRATQILVKRVESIRLCNFAQITNPTYNPSTFTDYYDPQDQASGGGGTVYRGRFTASVPPVGSVPEGYRTNVLLVTVGVTWNSGGVQHARSLQTYAAREGIESYVSTGQ